MGGEVFYWGLRSGLYPDLPLRWGVSGMSYVCLADGVSQRRNLSLANMGVSIIFFVVASLCQILLVCRK